jgi:hypothetical protein
MALVSKAGFVKGGRRRRERGKSGRGEERAVSIHAGMVVEKGNLRGKGN